MDKKRKQKNMLIGGLLAIVLVMAVGYAAFATNLNINGTANITSNWCIGFDSSKTSDYVATSGISGGATPTASMSYSGNTCETSYKTDASLNATFTQPGDKVVYTLTIANKSSLEAAIESINVDGSSVTSNQTKTKGNIKFTIEMPQSTTLSANAQTTMKVTAEFQNDTNISTSTTESQSITVSVNAAQSDGTNGMTVQNAFTGTIYRNNTTGAAIGSSIVAVSGTKWCDIETSSGDQYDCFDTESECNAYLSDNNYTETDTCQQKTVTSEGIGEYTTNASTLNKTYYLKHDVVDNIITASYVCFVTDTEHCMQGGDSSYYSANKTLLQGQESWFNNHSGSCSFGASDSHCSGGGFYYVGADSSGGVNAGVSESDGCGVGSGGNSSCSVSESGGGSGSGGGAME